MWLVPRLQEFPYLKSCWRSPMCRRKHQEDAGMHRLLCSLIILSFLTVATSVGAQDTLNLNQTYRDVIRLTFDSGSTQIPLPPGDWVLAGYSEPTSTNDKRLVTSYFARVENQVLTGMIRFTISAEMSDSGWSVPSFCERKDVVFVEKLSAYDGGDIDCWGVNHRDMGWRNSTTVHSQMLYRYLTTHKLRVPPFMPYLQYYKADSTNYLNIRYFFNPDVEDINVDKTLGWPYSEWHRSYIDDHPEKVAYLERLKLWGRKWKRKVDAGFQGKLNIYSTKSKKAAPPIKQSAIPVPLSGKPGDIETRLIRLKELFDKGLIDEVDYNEKRRQILKGL